MPNEISQVIKEPERTDYSLKFQHFIEAAKELIRFDEVERALVLLEQMPAPYRDNPFPEIEALKRDIKAALITPHAYMTASLDQDVTIEGARNNVLYMLRGKILVKEMDNLKGKHPHIVDVGPGEYWAPLGLNELGYKFSYYPVAMDTIARAKATPLLMGIPAQRQEGAPTVFVAHEIIEHLPSTQDLVIEALRHCGGWPDYVHLSTPCYTYDVQEKNWNRPNGLPHLRAYTPNEFIAEARKLFPGYNWEWKADQIQSLRGYKVGPGILGE